ncbi:hypothetical protein Tco_1004021 [Tanacetum coccineum]|uniref:Uncharacterized protein n=1 Tax=Tanacetum coccineum TaxID=301880 RepID=A0ABQ5FC14_9ASTR
MAEGLSARMLMEHRDAQGAILDLDTPGALQFQLGRARRHLNPILRLCHRLIACSIAGRSQAPKKMTVTDLFYLRGMDVDSVNFPYLLARYLRLFAARRKSRAHIFGGQFMARLAEHFGLLTAEILGGLTVITRELSIIDMAELVRLQIYTQFNDTWDWVAIGPERQPDVADGAPGVAQDAPIVDEGGQADPAPVQAVPPPRGHHVLPTFCTWTTTSLARMMDRAGVTYTSYSETPIEYTRRMRRRTGEASTSAVQHVTPPFLHIAAEANLGLNTSYSVDTGIARTIISGNILSASKLMTINTLTDEITELILVRDRCPHGKGLCFLDFFNDPRIIREQRIAAYKGYRGGGVVQVRMSYLSCPVGVVLLVKDFRMINLIMEYLVKVSQRRAFWSLNKDILKITILKTNTPYPSRKIRRIRACTHQRPQRKLLQYAVSREDQYAILEI